MAWIAPMTAIAGGVVAAADFNTYVRDNLNATEAALAANPGGFFATTGLHGIAERVFSTDFIDVNETRASSTYGNLATVGPTVTVTTGTKALVVHGARIGDNTAVAVSHPSNKMSWAVSGASTVAASDDWAAGIVANGNGNGPVIYTSRWYLATGLTAGSNTFQAKYANSSGTASFDHRSIHVLPL
jgi:hypothetical protein